MEIITKIERVFASSNYCPGCGSILGLKFLLQTLESLDNVILVASADEISQMGRSGLHVNFVSSKNPLATARGLAKARPDANVIVYSSSDFTMSSLNSFQLAEENLLYVCFSKNKLGPEFVRPLAHIVDYAASANVAYYEDFIAKLRKASSKQGLKFIEILCPCPYEWNYDSSNTIEIGRLATETVVWPLFEVENHNVRITKIPPRIEPVERYTEAVKIKLTDIQAMQETTTKNWKLLNEGRLI